MARNIIETCNVFHYVCEKRITKDEFIFRISLMSLHQKSDLTKILNAFSFTESDGLIRANDMGKRICLNMLNRNTHFLSYDEQQKEEFLKGRKAYYWNLVKDWSSPLGRKIESGIYNLLSNSVHSFPIGVNNSEFGGTDNHLNLYNLIFLSLEVSIIYLASTATFYLSVRPKLSQKVKNKDKALIKELISDFNIKEWIEYRKYIGERSFFGSKFLDN